MCAIREVVVVLPFEPVIPIMRPFRKRSASSISLQIVTPLARAACSNGASAGTPGLGIIKSCSKNVFSMWPRNSTFTPAERKDLVASPISLSPQLERPHLQNYGERFNHKDPADKKEQYLLLDNYGDSAERSPQRQRAHVAHENFRRVRVVPEETKRSAD